MVFVHSSTYVSYLAINSKSLIAVSSSIDSTSSGRFIVTVPDTYYSYDQVPANWNVKSSSQTSTGSTLARSSSPIDRTRAWLSITKSVTASCSLIDFLRALIILNYLKSFIKYHYYRSYISHHCATTCFPYYFRGLLATTSGLLLRSWGYFLLDFIDDGVFQDGEATLLNYHVSYLFM